MRNTCLCLIIFFYATAAYGQVDDIKRESSQRSGGRREGSTYSSGSAFAFDLVTFGIQGLIEWQTAKLQNRSNNPYLVSVDVIAQGAFQPSGYYILHPRLRANWGLFSTDFRMNYLIEESLEGLKHVRTTDWQVVQLNLVTERTVNFYIGFGFLKEEFNDNASFFEWSTAASVMPESLPIAFQVEYRHSDPRIELNGNVQYPVISMKSARLSFVAGCVYQRYYSSISVWGMQAGLMLKIF
jgi:hypothetical protein